MKKHKRCGDSNCKRLNKVREKFLKKPLKLGKNTKGARKKRK